MNKFDLSSREEINIYINSGLTPTELFILRLLQLAIDGDPLQLINYLSNVDNGKQLFRQVLESLKEKKVILSSFKVPCEGEALNYNNIPFNKNFVKMYIRESNEIGKELFDAYPPFITINGKLCSIKNFTRANLFSFDDFCLFYAKAIKTSESKYAIVWVYNTDKSNLKDEIKKSLTSISNFSTKCETSYLRKYNFDVYEPSIKKKIKKSSKDYFE